MERQLKYEEATIAKLKDQLKQHEEPVKERKIKTAAVKSEGDEAVQDHDAHKKEPDGDGDDEADGEAAMAAPVPGPAPTPSQEPKPAEMQKAAAEAKTRAQPAAPEAPAKKAQTDGDTQMGDAEPASG